MMGLLHVLLCFKDRRNPSYYFSTLMAMSAGSSAIFELALLQAQSTEAYAQLLKLEVTSIYVLLIPMVWLVSIQLGSYQRWLAYVITAIWSVALVFNFLSPGSLVYEQVSEINRSMTFWGEHYGVGSGPANPWNMLANLGVVLIIVYVILVARKAWQQGSQRRAITLGGSIVVFMLLAGTHSMLVDNGIVSTPYMVSFAYLAIVLAMSYELVDQAIQVPVLNREIAINQKRWQDLLENVQLAVIAVDNDGIITYANPYLQKLTGYSEPELIQKYAAMLLPAAEQASLRDRLQQALLEGPRPHSQWRIVCASGVERYLVWSSVRQFDSEGRVAGLVSVGTDITDQLQAQHDLQQSQQEMERMVRANLLGELASTMAHELNQPLAAILSNAQAARRMLAKNKLEETMLAEILDDIVRDDKRAGEVIHGVRAMLRHGEVSREQLAVSDIVDEVVRIVKTEADTQGIRLTLTMAPELPPVQVNKIEIQQVLMNLIVNAMRIQQAKPRQERFVHVQVTSENDQINFTVRDRGPGIKTEAMDKIFEPFFTTRREGLGMGLALSRRIVQAHGGRIWAENHPEGGAVFSFTIPVMET